MNDGDKLFNRVLKGAQGREQEVKEQEELQKEAQLQQEQELQQSTQPIQPASGRGAGRAAFKDTNKDRKVGETEEELTNAVVGGVVDIYNSVGSLPKLLDKKFYQSDDPDNPYKYEAPWLITEKPITKTVWGGFIRTGIEMTGGLVGTGKVLWSVKGLKGLATTARATKLGRAGLSAVQGGVYDAISNQSQEQNLARSLINIKPNWASVLNPIATNEDMSPAMRSVYNIGEGLGIGGLFDTAIEGAGWFARETSQAARKAAKTITKVIDPLKKAISSSADIDYASKTFWIEKNAKAAFERSMFRKLKNKGEVEGDIKAWRKTKPWEKLINQEQRNGLMQKFADKNSLDWGPERNMDLRAERQLDANRDLAQEQLEYDLATGAGPRENPAYYKLGDVTDNQALSSSTNPVKGVRDMIEIRNDANQKYGSPRGTVTEATIRRAEYSAPGILTEERNALARTLIADPAYEKLYGQAMPDVIAKDLADSTSDLIQFVNESGHSRLMDIPQEDILKYIKAKDAGKPTVIEGIGSLNKAQLVATDTILGQLLYETRDLAKAALSVQDQVDVAANGSLLDSILARYAGIARLRKETSMLSSFELRKHNAGGKLKDTIEEADLRGKASNAATEEIATFKQLLKGDVDDDLLETFLHFTATSNGNKQSWKDFHAFFRNKLHGTGFTNKSKYERGAIINELQTMGINSMLSGPKTPMRALIGTGIQTAARPVATMIGALGDPNGRVFRGAAQTIGAMIDARAEAWRKAIADFQSYSMKDDGWRGYVQNRKDQEWEAMRSYFDQHGTLGEQASMNIANTLREINKMPVFNYGPRTMRAIDTYFSQIIARGRQRQLAFDDVWTELKMREGQDLAVISDADMQRLVKEAETRFEDKVFSADGTITDEMAIFAADEAKLTEELTGWAKGFDDYVDRLPFIRPFFLFARTGVNALRMTGKYTPILNKFIKEHADIMGKNWDDPDMIKYGIKSPMDLEIAKATARGRTAIGAGFIGTASWMALDGRITGNGPPDRGLRDTWIQNGWQPRSIKIGDTYVSYEALEPFNTLFSMVADTVDAQKVMGDEWASNHFSKLSFLVAQNVTNKTFLAGLLQVQDLLTSQGNDAPRVAANFVNNQIPLSGMRNEIGKLLYPGMRELETGFWQSVGNRNLWADIVTKDGILPYKYDILNGERIRDWNQLVRFTNALLPFNLNPSTNQTRELLFRSGMSLKQTFNTGPNGEGLEHFPDIKSRYQFYMGQQNLEAQLTEFYTPEMINSILTMEKDHRSGDHYVGNQTLHGPPLRALFHNAKQNAWALLLQDPQFGGQAQQLELLHKTTQLGHDRRRTGDYRGAKELMKEADDIKNLISK